MIAAEARARPPLCRHGERLALDLHEMAADLADRPVEPRRLRRLQIRKELLRPAAEVTVEEGVLLGERGRPLAKGAGDQPRHRLAQRRDMVLGLLGLLLLPDDAEARHVAAQLGERLLEEKARQIIGAVGRELAAGKAYEERVILLLEPFGTCAPCGRGELVEGKAEHARVAIEGRHPHDELGTRRLREETRQQRISLRAEGVLLGDRIGGLIRCLQRQYPPFSPFRPFRASYRRPGRLFACHHQRQHDYVTGFYRPSQARRAKISCHSNNLRNGDVCLYAISVFFSAMSLLRASFSVLSKPPCSSCVGGEAASRLAPDAPSGESVSGMPRAPALGAAARAASPSALSSAGGTMPRPTWKSVLTTSGSLPISE